MLADHLGDTAREASSTAPRTTPSKAAFRAGVPNRPGAEELLTHLQRLNLPRAVGTNSSTEAPRQARRGRARRHFGDPCHGPRRGRRAETRARCLPRRRRRLGAAPERCVAFEDSETGVAAALAAGMVVVHVPDRRPPDATMPTTWPHRSGRRARLRADRLIRRRPRWTTPTRTELEAAAFRALRAASDRQAAGGAEHRPDEPRRLLPQLPLALVSGGGNERGIEMTKEEAREIFYGMPYDDWRAQHQTEADADKKAAFENPSRENVGPPKS